MPQHDANKTRQTEAGIILVNVLLVIALASSILFVMIRTMEQDLSKVQLMSFAAQARALALAGEASARVVLRRDKKEAPQSDHFKEPWAQIQQQEIKLPQGRFSLVVEDVQGRFNINNLASGQLQYFQAFKRLLEHLELQSSIAKLITVDLVRNGPLSNLSQLKRMGLDRVTLEKLTPFIAVLPTLTKININTAPAKLLGAMINNTTTAQLLVNLRDRQGFLDRKDLQRSGVILPVTAGFVSDHFEVTTKVKVGDFNYSLISLLQRKSRFGAVSVNVLQRQLGVAR